MRYVVILFLFCISLQCVGVRKYNVEKVKNWPIEFNQNVDIQLYCRAGLWYKKLDVLSRCRTDVTDFYLNPARDALREAKLKDSPSEKRLIIDIIDQYGPTPELSNLLGFFTLGLYPSISEDYLTVRIEVQANNRKVVGAVSKTETYITIQETLLIFAYPFLGDPVADRYPEIIYDLTKAALVEIKERGLLEERIQKP
ncbi:hypothetical protein [Leptospira kmetyi]|uniref:hypothetical protein n=1 Tax=Leptospira kmetyi TaxID=408139 RepID=UPI001083F71D|nr:hypothetical protein [Leptospira kmetyi]TGK12920.1 hypothetical protein EHO62_19025 [Leptospira kmetyi]TGK26929.1 hypothetical protein EHO66_16645 [Leptospira kmetyi]